MSNYKADVQILNEVDGDYTASTIFVNYHHWANIDLMPHTVLAGYLILWLKRCVVPSPPREALSIKAIYSVVRLASGQSLGLLPATTGFNKDLEQSITFLLLNPSQLLETTYLTLI